MDPVASFLSRCDAACIRLNWKRSTLSTKLFMDGKRLDELAAGKSDVGARRLVRAMSDLETLEREAA